MAQQQSQHGISKPTPTVLIPEILSFSPNFLLDDTINIANDGVGRAVDAMEDFLNRWAETRLEHDPDWADAADKELEQGLVSFQTLLEFHTDIAFDFFEAWSLRNIFAITPPDLPLVVPHQAGLDLDHQSPEKEAELLAEIDELRRKIENVRCLRVFGHWYLFIHDNFDLAAKTFETTLGGSSASLQTARKTSTEASRSPLLYPT
jgi:Mis12 protein